MKFDVKNPWISDPRQKGSTQPGHELNVVFSLHNSLCKIACFTHVRLNFFLVLSQAHSYFLLNGYMLTEHFIRKIPKNAYKVWRVYFNFDWLSWTFDCLVNGYHINSHINSTILLNQNKGTMVTCMYCYWILRASEIQTTNGLNWNSKWIDQF